VRKAFLSRQQKKMRQLRLWQQFKAKVVQMAEESIKLSNSFVFLLIFLDILS